MPEKVLIVDDDDSMLEFTHQVLKETDCDVITMNDPVAALEYLGREMVAVLVSDNNMPVMHGLELIEKANSISPETVKIIMSGFTDLSMVLTSINQCQVFKFVPKPWKPKEMFDAVTDALKRYHTLQTLRYENEDVLRSLAQTIELKDPYTSGHCDRVATLAVQIATLLDLPIHSQQDIKYGSWLHDCGKIGIPEKVLNANRKLEPDEYELIKKHPGWGADVARKAKLSEVIVNIILCHHEHFDGTGYPNALVGKDIPIEARIVSVADVFDALTSDRPYRKGMSLNEALETVVSMKGKELDPDMVDLFLDRRSNILKEDPQYPEIETSMENQAEVNVITFKGDFSIAGIDAQLPFLKDEFAKATAFDPSDFKNGRLHEIDLTGLQALDASGCQLISVFFRNLRQRGIGKFSLKLSETYREKIQFLGFAEEFFSGECL